MKPEKIDEYRRAHQSVWPEMLSALQRHGWHNYSLFLKEDGLLVGYFETASLADALAGMQSEEINARWQAEMSDYFVSLEGRAADQSFELLEQVFYLT